MPQIERLRSTGTSRSVVRLTRPKRAQRRRERPGRRVAAQNRAVRVRFGLAGRLPGPSLQDATPVC